MRRRMFVLGLLAGAAIAVTAFVVGYQTGYAYGLAIKPSASPIDTADTAPPPEREPEQRATLPSHQRTIIIPMRQDYLA